MSQQNPTFQLSQTADYRDNYSNSVQVRVSVWDFFLTFGTARQESAEAVNVTNFQGIYLSPQQAKALLNVLAQNVKQYEETFGVLQLEPAAVTPNGPIH